MTAGRSPRHVFRVLTQRRGGYQGAEMFDVQLQVAATGALVWAQTFTDKEQGAEFLAELEADIDTMEDEPFRKKYSVPRSA